MGRKDTVGQAHLWLAGVIPTYQRLSSCRISSLLPFPVEVACTLPKDVFPKSKALGGLESFGRG